MRLFFCGSAQMIMKNDLRRIIIFLNTKHNLTIKLSGLKSRILLWETATFPMKSVSALSHAFGSWTLIVHTA